MSRTQNRVGTPGDRAALFREIVDKIMARDAFVPIKLERLGLDVRRELLRYRDELINADSDEKLLYALIKINNARKDPHVPLRLVPGGVAPPGLVVDGEPVVLDNLAAPHAPIRFAVDYRTTGRHFFFVADLAHGVDWFGEGPAPAIGDRLLAVNGQPIADYVACAEPYHRYATPENLWWRLAARLPQQTPMYPPHFYGDGAAFRLERRDGTSYEIALPYCRDAGSIAWRGFWREHGEPRYPGFQRVFETSTYDLYRYDGDETVLLLDWGRFDRELVANFDRLLDYAVAHDLLSCPLIFDGTRARGGSLGAYVIQRLTSRPFKTTFGNLRLTDMVEPFIAHMRRTKASGEYIAAVDGGDWLLDWLETDVARDLAAGAAYTGDVPFKSAHLPKDADGVLNPAKTHFQGPLVCLFSPHGGSHLDQFAAMITDNDLAHTIGMPTAGYSNTWEAMERLYFPRSNRPVAELMYSMGHTIRPNGELLEGNPAQVKEYIPLTRDNHLEYYRILLGRAFTHIGLRGAPVEADGG